MPRPSHSSQFDYPNNIWWWVQVIKLRCVTLTKITGKYDGIAESVVIALRAGRHSNCDMNRGKGYGFCLM
jgi:hypothetical protein